MAMEFHIFHTPWRVDEYAVVMLDRLAQGKAGRVKSLEFEIMEEGGIYPEPSLTMTKAGLQAIYDNLHALGIRPTRPVVDAGSLAAHLEDMRQIAFGKLNIPKP